jgi:hypothetical protein
VVERVGTWLAVSLQGFTGEVFGEPRPGSLSTVIGSFKSAVTKQIHERGLGGEKSLWQPRFYDHIIRDDVDHFFIQQYIQLNPIMWDLDSNNPGSRNMPAEILEKILQHKYGLGDLDIVLISNPNSVIRNSLKTTRETSAAR